MFAIETAVKALRLPAVMFLGLVLMATGGVVDVGLQLWSADHPAHRAFAAAHTGHLVAIAGMALVLAGVVAHGARPHRRRRAATHGGPDSNAHR